MSMQHMSGDLFKQLIAVAGEAFAGRHFSVAYHALAAAYHCASDNNDESQLSLVERVALEHLRWIDANVPAYEHSTKSAAGRNHMSIFFLLSQQASIKLRFIAIGR
jgi:hypothetical protein